MPSPNPQRELIVLLDEQLDALQKECFGGAGESDIRASKISPPDNEGTALHRLA